MSGKINVLEKQVAEMIAAGEVVERPASIAKELIENSIDAGATSIAVEVQNGGIGFLRVTDNGEGIAAGDVPTAFIRHATSKVRSPEDLHNICTMGFRGEALPSICAMSRMELITRTKDAHFGTRYLAEGGEMCLCEETGAPLGTTVIVRDLFYNTPARMKFLKRESTEAYNVGAFVEKAALSHPHIAFRFIKDGETKLRTPGDGSLLSAIRSVLGGEFAKNILPVEFSREGVDVSGFVTLPSLAKGSRSLQNFFINNRFIQTQTCMSALQQAYQGKLMSGRFPGCVLHLYVPAQLVDVNVHPAKLQVRFADEKTVFHAVYYGVLSALEQYVSPDGQRPAVFFSGASQESSVLGQTGETVPPELSSVLSASVLPGSLISSQQYRKMMQLPPADTPAPVSPKNNMAPNTHTEQHVSSWRLVESLSTSLPTAPSSPAPTLRPTASLLSPDPNLVTSVVTDTTGKGLASNATNVPGDAVLSVQHSDAGGAFVDAGTLGSGNTLPRQTAFAPVGGAFADARMIGEFHNTYILLEQGSDLLFVDKHAAHERILYNQLQRQGVGDSRQVLFCPVTIRLTSEEYALALEHLPLFSQGGLELADFGDNCLVLREIAPVLQHMDCALIVEEFLHQLAKGNDRLHDSQLEQLYHTIACRSAIKGGDNSPLLSLEELIRLLQQEQDASCCPHGRPVCIRIPVKELEKRFGRLG